MYVSLKGGREKFYTVYDGIEKVTVWNKSVSTQLRSILSANEKARSHCTDNTVRNTLRLAKLHRLVLLTTQFLLELQLVGEKHLLPADLLSISPHPRSYCITQPFNKVLP